MQDIIRNNKGTPEARWMYFHDAHGECFKPRMIFLF
jgi:hypothetical protein